MPDNQFIEFEIEIANEVKAAELANSRLLDVHRWSEHPEVDAFINPIYEAHFVGRKGEIRKRHLKVLLLDLYLTWIEDPTRYTTVHRNPNEYRAGSRYNELHISRKTIDVVDAMLVAGLIEQQIGWLDRANGIGRLTRIRPMEALREQFSTVKFEPFDIGSLAGRTTVVLRDLDSRNVEYEDDEATLKMADSLNRYNSLLRRTFIDIPTITQGELTLASKTSRGTRISQNDKFVTRIFNRGSFEFGGRLFGGWWQNCPKSWRSLIFMDDWPTSEIDFSGLHIVMLYALLGTCYWDHHDKDPYDVDAPEFLGEKAASRTAIKQLFLISINAESPAKAFQAFRQSEPAGSLLKRLTNGQLARAMHSIEMAHPAIAHFLNADMGVRLMRRDSDITMRIVDHFAAQHIPVLCVHDSYIVPSGHDEELKGVMHRAFEEVMGVPLGRKHPQAAKEVSERVEDMEGFLLSNWQPYGSELDQEQAEYIKRRFPKKSQRYKENSERFNRWININR